MAVDVETKVFVAVNEAICRMLGYSRDEILKLGMKDVHPTDDLPQMTERLKRRFKGDIMLAANVPMKRKDGSVFHVDINSAPIVLGDRPCLIGVFRDVAERKRTEEALRESEERLRLAQISANVGIWDWNPRTGECVFTPELNQLYGLPPARGQTYRDWHQRVHPDDIARIEAERDEAIASHKPFDLECRIIHSSGEVRWLSAKGGAFYDETGQPVRVLGVNVDITVRKSAEEALCKSEQKYRHLYESMRDAFVMVDMTGQVREFNSAFQMMTGYSKDELLELTYMDLTPPQWHRMETSIVNEQILTRGHSDVYEKEYRRKDGSVIPVELRTFLLRNDSGRPRGMWAIVRDITERKRAEAEMARAKEASEAANRAKSEFLANMSHEIRTPMTAILGFSDLLMAPNLNRQDRQEFLQGIQRNGQALVELLNDILDISKIEAGKLALEPEDCSIQQVVDDTLSILKVRAEQKGLSLDVKYAEPLPITIITDPLRLRQILVNLVGNAIKFTEYGVVQILFVAKLWRCPRRGSNS